MTESTGPKISSFATRMSRFDVVDDAGAEEEIRRRCGEDFRGRRAATRRAFALGDVEIAGDLVRDARGEMTGPMSTSSPSSVGPTFILPALSTERCRPGVGDVAHADRDDPAMQRSPAQPNAELAAPPTA